MSQGGLDRTMAMNGNTVNIMENAGGQKSATDSTQKSTRLGRMWEFIKENKGKILLAVILIAAGALTLGSVFPVAAGFAAAGLATAKAATAATIIGWTLIALGSAILLRLDRAVAFLINKVKAYKQERSDAKEQKAQEEMLKHEKLSKKGFDKAIQDYSILLNEAFAETTPPAKPTTPIAEIHGFISSSIPISANPPNQTKFDLVDNQEESGEQDPTELMEECLREGRTTIGQQEKA
jgi:hypothetical protein